MLHTQVQIADLEGQVLDLQERLREEADNSARETRAADEAARMAEHRGLQVHARVLPAAMWPCGRWHVSACG